MVPLIDLLVTLSTLPFIVSFISIITTTITTVTICRLSSPQVIELCLLPNNPNNNNNTNNNNSHHLLDCASLQSKMQTFAYVLLYGVTVVGLGTILHLARIKHLHQLIPLEYLFILIFHLSNFALKAVRKSLFGLRIKRRK